MEDKKQVDEARSFGLAPLLLWYAILSALRLRPTVWTRGKQTELPIARVWTPRDSPFSSNPLMAFADLSTHTVN